MKHIPGPTFAFEYAESVQEIYHADPGWGLVRHVHAWPHAVYCAKGAVRIKTDQKERVLTGVDQPVELPPNQYHEIEVLEPGTVFINTADRRLQNAAV